MRISDRCSDVCSSDLGYVVRSKFNVFSELGEHFLCPQPLKAVPLLMSRESRKSQANDQRYGRKCLSVHPPLLAPTAPHGNATHRTPPWRPEERREGQECVSTGRSRG